MRLLANRYLPKAQCTPLFKKKHPFVSASMQAPWIPYPHDLDVGTRLHQLSCKNSAPTLSFNNVTQTSTEWYNYVNFDARNDHSHREAAWQSSLSPPFHTVSRTPESLSTSLVCLLLALRPQREKNVELISPLLLLPPVLSKSLMPPRQLHPQLYPS